MSDLILYTTEDDQSCIQLRSNNDTVWLTRLKVDGDPFSALLRSIGEVAEAEVQE